MDKFQKSAIKCLKIPDKEDKINPAKMTDHEFEKLIFDTIAKANPKMWSDKHKAQEFSPNPEHDLSLNMVPVHALEDVFNY